MLEAMASSSGVTVARAREVWRAMFDLLIRSAPERTKSLARRGLTPNDSRALFSLDAQTGRSMRSLADQWECDPSYATAIVDRLERLGLAKRQVVSHDRRIKLVMLTHKGQKTKDGTAAGIPSAACRNSIGSNAPISKRWPACWQSCARPPVWSRDRSLVGATRAFIRHRSVCVPRKVRAASPSARPS